ncbi:hypothetical protein [Paenibacillus piri]|uniref:Uncharacterized protein n=1 Tax=Paenibacillus piri TaxID=2547395 RepID=A0A4R5K8J2_9BACL|nr:hypothetical protein [Paenibacillus piri]TDF91122.1 hypothetical protein E1757_33350 [Paenibacillus piri]
MGKAKAPSAVFASLVLVAGDMALVAAFWASGDAQIGGASSETHPSANWIGLPSMTGGPSAHSSLRVNWMSAERMVT